VSAQRVKNYSLANHWIHVSDLCKTKAQYAFCPRERVLTYLSPDQTLPMTVSPGMSLLFKLGHTTQDHITESFIQRSPYGHLVWGDWQCHCAKRTGSMQGLTIRHSYKPARGQFRCNECGGEPEHYKEIDLVLENRRLVAHPDILILWGDTLYIYEVKTIDREAVDFDTLDTPLGEHTLQASFYYWIIRDMIKRGVFKFSVSPHIRYIYVDRGNKRVRAGKVYKEFVKVTSQAKRIEDRLALSDQVIKGIETNALPARICKTTNDARAKNCPKCVACFSRKRPTFRV
jgi:hypothetical protein